MKRDGVQGVTISVVTRDTKPMSVNDQATVTLVVAVVGPLAGAGASESVVVPGAPAEAEFASFDTGADGAEAAATCPVASPVVVVEFDDAVSTAAADFSFA